MKALSAAVVVLTVLAIVHVSIEAGRLKSDVRAWDHADACIVEAAQDLADSSAELSSEMEDVRRTVMMLNDSGS